MSTPSYCGHIHNSERQNTVDQDKKSHSQKARIVSYYYRAVPHKQVSPSCTHKLEAAYLSSQANSSPSSQASCLFRLQSVLFQRVALITQQAWIGNPTHAKILKVIAVIARRQRFWNTARRNDVLKQLCYIKNCQKMRRNRPCSLMGPVTSWVNIGCGRPLNRALDYKFQELLKLKVNHNNLQRWRPSSWL